MSIGSFGSGLILALALGAAASGAWAQVPSPTPAQVNEAALKPGLEVEYYYMLFREVDEVADWMKDHKGQPGTVLPAINYRVGEGTVLTSTNSDGVGAHIHGLVKFDKPGTWSLSARSNDGVRVLLGGKPLFEDPDVHSDRFSEPADVEIKTPGWYALEVLYFERRNTATLELYWTAPDGDGKSALIPAAAFAHQES
jgi:hypothetical protein